MYRVYMHENKQMLMLTSDGGIKGDFLFFCIF